MRYVKSFQWVMEHRHDKNVRIVDCRFQLNDPKAGEKAYQTSHLPNAVYLNLETDLSGPVKEHGGRHPLPRIEDLTEKLSNIGINEKVTVIAYDDQNGAMASRLWWLLRYLGHEEAYVMNGSFSKWIEEGLPVESKVPSFENRNFQHHLQSHMLATMDEVRDHINFPNTTLIDSREEKRYKGIEEPIDKKAGHIPGALNFFWQEAVEKDGTWKDARRQRERFQQLSKEQQVIVYCGSGVTACPNVLALKNAGYEDVKLYLGSWSDWISYSDNPFSTK
jgi:thiosulfate/3-mercaptopyruvate sulfurtransferase